MKNFAISALFAAGVSAIPMAAPKHAHQHHHQKRDVVWVTETAVDVVTQQVVKTVYWDGHSYSTEGGSPTTTVLSTATVHPVAYTPSSSAAYSAPASSAPETTSSSAPAYTPTTSAYVAPTTSSSSSVYVAPTSSSTTSEYSAPAYTPTTSYQAPATTSSAPAATSSSSGSTSAGGMSTAAGTASTGDFTWYEDGMGACGWTSGPDDAIVAISEKVYDLFTVGGNPNNNPLCGRSVTLTGADGSTHTAKVVDRCTGCAPGDLDLSHGFFQTVTGQTDGRISNSKWEWA